MAKDRTMPVLSTGEEGKPAKKSAKPAKAPPVKAVNQNSNPELSRLSKKSVDNIV
ncbi:hypothetical protein LHK94_05070 [Dickeya zeae]|uniref:hypothetical protein n=1 Tax=Dickeya TaxID=204037 RepID=UPI0012FC75CB|nr:MULTISPECIES: hypothetical protein [Dickeya]UCZ76367.1 hypothetical protein LHK94_05070 [Dickeya zeae]